MEAEVNEAQLYRALNSSLGSGTYPEEIGGIGAQNQRECTRGPET